MRSGDTLSTSAIWPVFLITLAACTPTLISSWKAPDVSPFPLSGEKVAAVVMTTEESIRRSAEDALANELTRRGAHGIPMYTVFPNADPNDESGARAAAERAGVVGVVVMRPVRIDKEISLTPMNTPTYGGFWGSYYGHGWGSPWGPGMVSGGDIRTDTVIVIETLVYGLHENKLLWAGQSKTMNPVNVDRLIEHTAAQVASELERIGLISET